MRGESPAFMYLAMHSSLLGNFLDCLHELLWLQLIPCIAFIYFTLFTSQITSIFLHIGVFLTVFPHIARYTVKDEGTVIYTRDPSMGFCNIIFYSFGGLIT